MNEIEKLLADLVARVDAELEDHTIPSHLHGRPSGYNKGCKGPLCTKSNRDRVRLPGTASRTPIEDMYLNQRLAEHKESLKKKDKVA
ncbi:hypothetical protein GMA7_96 [Gordonia phage GMA7]|uniref:Uncharacterized protein n=1 Tax=Gordonia phage GMA7 TaxID=1647286 RepID=A0A0K0N720_9CAUD|nr:hypothetical protein AU104_gp023 [Gordonia phage GMA7]AKJ72532.1 hypothetical protein GMA7_96 [Gordonia phage GMA7]